MNKTVKIILGATLAVGVFSVGFFGKDVYTKATTDWKTNAINDANSELGSAGYNKKEELKASADTDISATVQEQIGTEVDQQKADLEKLLEQYYQMKLDGLTDTSAYKDLETQIASIKESILQRYKNEIDQVFASQAK